MADKRIQKKAVEKKTGRAAEHEQGSRRARRIVIGVCGASGIGYALHLLESLRKTGIESHVIASDWAREVLQEEEHVSIESSKALADYWYDSHDMAAAVSSSSFLVDGMVVVPATVKTVGEIAHGITSNLISRCADNMFKMQKPLVVCIRETPLSGPCLKNLHDLAVYGAIVMPLAPAFYHHPKSIGDLRAFMSGKIMDALDIRHNLFLRWKCDVPRLPGKSRQGP